MTEENRGAKRRLVGRVTSDKMQKTIVVEVTRQVIDPLYGKVIRRRARFKAHDERNDAKIGDRVEVEESRPLSRDKRWRLVKVLDRAVVVD
jgi:small subunit ribosomal protein S17